MEGPLVTIGMPVYRGADMLPTTLACIRDQSYRNLDVLISIDGADEASADACGPFLSDPRFRMHIQPTLLGWAGNQDWTVRKRRGDFFVYQQHDDQVSETYIADLVAAAARWPQASVCYSEMAVSGSVNTLVRHESIVGDPIGRALTHMERLDTSMFRGLIRGSAIDRSDGLPTNEFESFGADQRYMTQLVLAGEFRFVEGPTYYKRLHGANLHLKWYKWSEERKQGAWTALAAGILEVIVPAGDTMQQRRQLWDTVLERFLVSKEGRWIFCTISNEDLGQRSALLASILERLRDSGQFDPDARLDMDWTQLKAHAAARLGLS